MSDVADDLPLVFKAAAGERRSQVVLGKAGASTFVCEARQIGVHFKEAIVREGDTGSTWRFASDEGTQLRGTDLAPFPLGYFNCGLQADLAASVARLAAARGIPLDDVRVGVSTRYGLEGSFAQGTALGFAEAVGAHVALRSTAPDADLTDLVAASVEGSPAFDLVGRPLENTFALYCNGRRRHAAELPPATGEPPSDPFLKYASAPVPLPQDHDIGDLVFKSRRASNDRPSAMPPHEPGRIRWVIDGEGELDPATGLYHGTAMHQRPGVSWFDYVCATEEDRAPSGLALVTAAIAFCYMTQLSRYIEAMELDVRSVRLVQRSPYSIDARSHGAAAACETHLFLQGAATEAEFERLQLVASRTCYLHQTMRCATPLRVTVSNGPRMIG